MTPSQQPDSSVPPPPAGFTLDAPASMPAPPAGFTLDAPSSGTPSPSLLSRAADLATTPISTGAIDVAAPAMGAMTAGADYLQKKESEEIASGNPVRAALASFFGGTLRDTHELVRSMTSPTNAALLAGTMGESALAESVPALGKAVASARTLAMTYFGLKGGQEALTGRLPDETQADEVQRRLFGLSAATITPADLARSTGRVVQTHMQKHFGLDRNLSDQVQSHLAAMNEQHLKLESYDSADRAAVEANKGNVEGAEAQLQRNGQAVRAAGARAQQDFVDSINTRKAQLGETFDKVEAKLKSKPLSTVNDVAKMVDEGLQAYGVSDADRQALNTRLSKGIGSGGPEYRAAQKAGLVPGDDLDYGDLKNLQGQLEKEMSRGTPQVRAGVGQAYRQIGDIRQSAADEAGLGDEHAQARAGYADIMRQLRDPVASKLMDHTSIEEKVHSERLASLLKSDETTEVVKNLFKWAGVDTAPLDSLHEDAGNLQAAIKESNPDLIPNGMRSEAKAALQSATDPEEGPKAAVPGEKYDTLADKSEFQLRKMRIDKMMDAARGAGMNSPLNWVLISIGLMKMMEGSQFGVFTAGIGGGRELIRNLHTNPRFSTWYAHEGGIDNVEQASRILRAMAAGVAEQRASRMDSGNRNP